MDAVVLPGQLAGTVRAPASKSVAHRALICAATCAGTTNLRCNATSQDIEATVRCLRGLGARIARTRDGLRVVPLDRDRAHGLEVTLDVGESGSTLRFLLPVAAALGAHATFVGRGRLGQRPLAPLLGQLRAHGVSVSAREGLPLEVSGRLHGGGFRLPGDVSSQFASGLILAAPLVDEAVCVLVDEPVESAPYLRLTADVLARFGADVEDGRVERDGARCRRLAVDGGRVLSSPGALAIEGDWSNAAFWLAAGALSRTGVEVTGVEATSAQGDRAITAALALLGARVGRGAGGAATRLEQLRPATLDLADTPDLAAPLAAVCACVPATSRLAGAGRLRLKESDRLATIAAALSALGAHAEATDDALLVKGGALAGGTVDAAGDHRIAMMAAVAATVASGPTTIRGAECVAKSYPAFFEDFAALGGQVELQGSRQGDARRPEC